MSRPTVTFVTHTASPGGAELALLRYLSHQTAFRARLVTFEDGPLWQQLRGTGTCEVSVLEGSLTTQLLALRRWMADPDDIVVANTMRAAFYCAVVRPRQNRHLLYWVRDQLVNSSMSQRNLMLTRAVTLRRVTGCLANSRTTAETVSLTRPSMPVHVVHSLSGISGAETSARRKVRTPPRRFLFLGRLTPWKGPDMALRALAAMPPTSPPPTLTIAGAPLFGEEAFGDDLMLLAHSLGVADRVTFAGHVPDVLALLRRHDVLLHCSRAPEPFGQVIVQGMASGAIVVAANAGGPADIITDGADGFTYEIGDEDALQGAIEHIVSTPPETLQAVSERAQQRAADFDDDACMRATRTAILTLAGIDDSRE